MESKKATKPIQSQLLLDMGVPADTADAYYETGTNELLFIPSGMSGSQFVYRVAWTLDGLIDYLCDGDNVYVEFRRSIFGNGSFWFCYYRRYEEGKGLELGVSKAGPSKIDAIFEVIYELHKHQT